MSRIKAAADNADIFIGYTPLSLGDSGSSIITPSGDSANVPLVYLGVSVSRTHRRRAPEGYTMESREDRLREVARIIGDVFGADDVHIQLIYADMEADVEIGSAQWEEFLTHLRKMQSSR